jgi:hypothetical protein
MRADDELRSRIDDNRNWMAKELSDKVDLDIVMRTLPTVETAPRFGVLACLTYLAHLYRWGTLPVVRIAQDENQVPGMPEEIEGPLRCLNAAMGIKTNGGCESQTRLLRLWSLAMREGWTPGGERNAELE